MIDVRVVSPITTKGFRKESDLFPLGGDIFKVSASQIDIGPASIESEFDEAIPRNGSKDSQSTLVNSAPLFEGSTPTKEPT